MRQVLIVHGYSDHSDSFRPLGRFLQQHGFTTVPLWLADYISLDDDVRIEDAGKRMEIAIREKLTSGELTAPFDIIVHSTGGLVAREWISAHYTGNIAACPAKRLIMLAPANFGSRLAAMGQSMLGRLIKGWNNWFHTGKEMLNALELASPYQWDLAQRDLFVPEGLADAPTLYGDAGVWPFIIVGSHPYTGTLRQIVNENGSDGTVRVCAANLNTKGITIDFAANEEKPDLWHWKTRFSDPFPFAVLPDRTHGSIINPDESDIDSVAEYRNVLGKLILGALQCENRDVYLQMGIEWNAIAEATAALAQDEAKRAAVIPGGVPAEYFHQYLQLHVRVVDDHELDVGDYFLEFSGPPNEKGSESTLYFHREILEDVHTNGLGPSHRAFYVDRSDLVNNYYGKIPGAVAKAVYMSISANPPGKNISYFDNYREGAKGTMLVHQQPEDSPESRWLKRNTTHFIKIVIPRTPSKNVFRLAKLD
ncbi:hypothetical protein HYR69_12340 [Candidatus Sumerlaeota bacterium]|nr:hypothetical protein [Candidatus Sumerlaeota bacterium]